MLPLTRVRRTIVGRFGAVAQTTPLPPRVSQGVLDGLPGQSHARACLLDHAAQLRDAVGELLAATCFR